MFRLTLGAARSTLELPIGRYFDLVLARPPDGSIAIGLGLGLQAAISQAIRGRRPSDLQPAAWASPNWVRQKLRGIAHLLVTALVGAAALRPRRCARSSQARRSRTRLLIPAWHPVLERVYPQNGHHPRLNGLKQPAIVRQWLPRSAHVPEASLTEFASSSSTEAFGQPIESVSP